MFLHEFKHSKASVNLTTHRVIDLLADARDLLVRFPIFMPEEAQEEVEQLICEFQILHPPSPTKKVTNPRRGERLGSMLTFGTTLGTS